MTAEIESGTGFVNVSFSTSTVASSKESYSVTVSLPLSASDDWPGASLEALHLALALREKARLTVEGAATAKAEEGTK